MSFGETLRRMRMEKGLSQQQLADMLYVDRSSVARWESGSRLPDAIMVTRLSGCLEVAVESLLAAAERADRRPNVFLLDDEKIILAGGLPVLAEALPGAEVTGFTQPSKALAFARQNRVDLAFLDIEIGQMNGLDLCRQFQEVNPRTNVVFLTAFADYSLEAWTTGASGFLLKPLTVSAIRGLLPLLRYKVRGLDEK